MDGISGAVGPNWSCDICKKEGFARHGGRSVVKVSCSKRHEFHFDCFYQLSPPRKSTSNDELICTVCKEPGIRLLRNGEDLASDISKKNDYDDYYVMEKINELNLDIFSETYTYDSGNVLTTPASNDSSSEATTLSVPINFHFCKKINCVNLDFKVEGAAEFDIDKVKKELVVRLPLFFEAKTVNVKSSGILEVREPFSEIQKGVFDSFKLAYNGKSSISISGSEFSLDVLHPLIIWYLTNNAEYYTKLLLPQIN
ncbi:hypothetical protein [Endozoicomonas sp. GU-1]|uniref:hypothetical protein n=1 Tax=Endozoicomonas sp. GU-1 TaxID=3009078 RepID=UPI0022B31A22|nr:hypothetical protein [Endozoicomonas sp. GU-1]WBA82954.1 hypothetical protein O2T12_07480 [Endozoicomonas sp. GU-1]WBA85880.1 hypothetical protein O3276_22115 [Endozoicomonas sp. GU-1]